LQKLKVLLSYGVSTSCVCIIVPMLLHDDSSFLSTTRVLPSDRDLEKLSCALRMAGGENGFSRRTIDRYQAWIFGYISWSLRTAPFEVREARIGDFVSSIKRHPEAGAKEVFEAMDALAFLYGALEDPDVLLSFDPERKGRVASHFRFRDAQKTPTRARLLNGGDWSENGKPASLKIGWTKTE